MASISEPFYGDYISYIRLLLRHTRQILRTRPKSTEGPSQLRAPMGGSRSWSMVDASPRHHYLSHIGPSVFAGKGLWKGPSGIKLVGRAWCRMMRARSANGMSVTSESTQLYRRASLGRSGASWQDPSIQNIQAVFRPWLMECPLTEFEGSASNQGVESAQMAQAILVIQNTVAVSSPARPRFQGDQTATVF